MISHDDHQAMIDGRECMPVGPGAVVGWSLVHSIGVLCQDELVLAIIWRAEAKI